MQPHDDLHVRHESTAFPCDRLRIRTLSGTESSSRLFDITIEIVSLDHDGPPVASIIGAPATLVIEGDAVALGEHAEMRLTGADAARELVVRYKESDDALVCRLAEHLGASFFFEHREAHEIEHLSATFKPPPGS